MKLPDITNIKHIHFVGIKGVGMAALAVWAKQKGISVSGSDIAEEFPTDAQLHKFSIAVEFGFNPGHIKTPDLVIATGAHGGLKNPEAVASRRKSIPTVLHGEALAWIMKNYRGIAVAGCHGKTTTSAIIAHLLVKGGLSPSFAIGCGEILSLGTAGWRGKGEYFVAEADEYINGPPSDKRPKFLFLQPQIAVITNIEFDHPDAYGDIADVEKAFLNFSKRVDRQGQIILGLDSPSVKKILAKIKRPVISYGFTRDATYIINKVSFKPGTTYFNLSSKKAQHFAFCLQIPGSHNIANAAAAALAAYRAGLSWKSITKHIATFTGTKRHFELVKKTAASLFYDDYAHHPTEIRATLAGARSWYPNARVVAIFQPHTYSRTKALEDDFCRAFAQADVVLLTDIYPSAREKPDATISTQKLVRKMVQYQHNVRYTSTKDRAIKFLRNILKPGDIIITMGAGDIYTWQKDIIKILP